MNIWRILLIILLQLSLLHFIIIIIYEYVYKITSCSVIDESTCVYTNIFNVKQAFYVNFISFYVTLCLSIIAYVQYNFYFSE